MNLRTLLPVLVLTTFVLLGCSTTPDAPAQVTPPDIEATVEARLAAVPTPTTRVIEVEVVKEVPKVVEVPVEVIKEVVVEKVVRVVVTATPTPLPTATATPTATPVPTPTPVPDSLYFSPGTFISSSLSSGGDVNSHFFRGYQGQVVTISMDGSSTLKSNLTLWRSIYRVASAKASKKGTAAVIEEYTLGQDATYRIDTASFNSASKGSYTLLLTIVAGPTPTPTPASTLAGTEALPIPTPVPPSSQQPSGSAVGLKINEVATSLPGYDRGDWRHWRDEDGDCQNTRHEVLIEESLREVTFKDDKRCQVATGEWLAPYSNVLVTDATTLDVDHMVPLKNAHDSGGWAWEKDKKADYANEMGYGNHLIAVTASANRQKGAAGPEKWKPLNNDYWCDYAVSWVQIKVRWGLSATEDEWAALQEMMTMCDNPPSIEASPSTSAPPTAVATVAPASSAMSGSTDIRIGSMDCKSKPEIVVVKNTGMSSQDMTGWRVEDDGPKYTFNFPSGFSLEPGASVKLISGESGDDTAEAIYWTGRTVWNNDGDTASLFNRSGELVSKKDCP